MVGSLGIKTHLAHLGLVYPHQHLKDTSGGRTVAILDKFTIFTVH
jgi:hypothetical protein